MAVTAASVADICRAAKAAARPLAGLDTATKNRALHAIAEALIERTPEILEANGRDLEAGRESGLSDALMDRLKLTPERIEGIAAGARAIAALPDPVGEVLDGGRLYNGLDVRRVRVPLGVVAVVYESRPNVTIDTAALALKSGNAIVLRGSRAAAHSNAILAGIAIDAAERNGIPRGAIALVAGGGREELAELATQDGLVDLIIPRGGEGLKNALKAVATVPVIYAAAGNCHVYVDDTADLDNAIAIALNAKTHRPGVCNAAETLLVHADIADEFLPRAAQALQDAGVELRGDERTRELTTAGAATEEDWATEYLALTLAVRVVDSLDEAIEHIGTYGSGHSEAIVTGSAAAARTFQTAVDAAVVYVNASTRFTDGGEFGMGAEIGNSTQKLHARGPIGLRELCTYKYLVEGSGQIRGMRIGVLGGTFNPPHIGHLICAQEACEQVGLDRVLFIPTRVPPHKAIAADPGPEERARLTGLAVAGDERFEVSHIELEREGPSYTVDTLRLLHAERPNDSLTFVLGGDMAHSLPTWREPEAIVALADLAIAERAGAARADIEERLATLPGAAERIHFFDMPRIDISSSLIRRQAAAGRSIRYLVPDAVAERIATAGLYREPATAGQERA